VLGLLKLTTKIEAGPIFHRMTIGRGSLSRSLLAARQVGIESAGMGMSTENRNDIAFRVV
jgi:hypothetical protein